MADEIHLTHEDRLPWLETVTPEEPVRGGTGRTALIVILTLLLLAAIIWAVFRVGHSAPVTPANGGDVIAAQGGAYKVRPDEPGGLKVAGEGDSAIATSTGKGAGSGRIDSRQVSETPVAASHPHVVASSAPAHGAASVTASVPARGGRLVAAAPVGAPGHIVSGRGGGGSLVQLGAFPTEAKANAAWGELAKRFGYLAALGKAVQPADVNGRKVFRLRVNAGSANAAAELAGKLKIAGEDCFVVS